MLGINAQVMQLQLILFTDSVQDKVPGFRARTLYQASMCYTTFHGLPVDDYAATESESSSAAADSAVPSEVALIGTHNRREFTYNWRSPKADVMVSMWKAEDGRMNGALTLCPMMYSEC